MGIILPQKSFYFVRHGFTNANRDHLWSGGGWDIDLNEIGVAQAKEAAKLIPGLNPDIDKIFCSPMRRSMQTTEIINSFSSKPVKVMENLREWKVGELEGKPYDKSILTSPIEKWGHPPGGESIFDFRDRVSMAFSACLSEAETPMISAHGAVGRVLLHILNISDRPIDNCQIYRFDPIIQGEAVSWEMHYK